MLSSIHPLGERARQHRWWITATAFLVGAIIGGTVLGLGSGVFGYVTHILVNWSAETALWAGVTVTIVAVIGDVVRGPRALPWPERQVNEDWLSTYRGWVYGIGFGFQLGVGVATYITTLGVPAVIVMAGLTASPALGASIGAVFGAFRGLAVFTTWRIGDPAALRAYHERMTGLAAPVRLVGLVGQIAVGALIVVVIA